MAFPVKAFLSLVSHELVVQACQDEVTVLVIREQKLVGYDTLQVRIHDHHVRLVLKLRMVLRFLSDPRWRRSPRPVPGTPRGSFRK